MKHLLNALLCFALMMQVAIASGSYVTPTTNFGGISCGMMVNATPDSKASLSTMGTFLTNSAANCNTFIHSAQYQALSSTNQNTLGSAPLSNFLNGAAACSIAAASKKPKANVDKTCANNGYAIMISGNCSMSDKQWKEAQQDAQGFCTSMYDDTFVCMRAEQGIPATGTNDMSLGLGCGATTSTAKKNKNNKN